MIVGCSLEDIKRSLKDLSYWAGYIPADNRSTVIVSNGVAVKTVTFPSDSEAVIFLETLEKSV